MPDTDNIYNLGYTGDKVKEAIEKALAIDNNPGSEDVYTKSEIDSKLDQKQNTLTFDNTPTSGSNNPVTSNGIKSALDTKANIDDVESDFQEKLTFDSTPTEDSVNPVTSGGVKSALDEKADADDVYTKDETDSQINSKLSNVYRAAGSIDSQEIALDKWADTEGNSKISYGTVYILEYKTSGGFEHYYTHIKKSKFNWSTGGMGDTGSKFR